MNNKLYVSILVVILMVSLAMAITTKIDSSKVESIESSYTEEFSVKLN